MLGVLNPRSASAVSWGSNLDSALRESDSSGKPVLVDFYTDWCGWCKKMDKDTYENSTVDELTRSFICVKIDGDKDPETTRKYNVSGYPTILFLNSKGNVIGTVGGYMPPNNFAVYLEEILKKSGRSKEKQDGSKGYGIGDALKDLAYKANRKIEKVRNHNLQLDGIFFEPKPSKAIINGKIVKIGDTIEGAKVVSIGKSKVELSLNDGKKLIIKID
jgi:thioredoxin-related protein